MYVLYSMYKHKNHLLSYFGAYILLLGEVMGIYVTSNVRYGNSEREKNAVIVQYCKVRAYLHNINYMSIK